MNRQAYGRREFLRDAGTGLAAAAALALFGCEETDLDNPPNSATPSDGSATNTPTPTSTPGATPTPSPSETPTPTYSDLSGAIANNHGHSVTLPAYNLSVGRGAVLPLTLGGGHTHTVSFSDRDVQAIAAGARSSAVSSVDAGHSHDVTFN